MEQKTITDQLQEQYDQMVANDEQGEDWKNIPLAKEMLQLLNQVTDEEDKDFAKELCETVLEEPYIFESKTPRIRLAFMEYCLSFGGDTNLWEKEIARLKRLIDPKVSEEEKLDLMRQKKSLLYDPIQLTEACENVIYDVLKEYAEFYKGKKTFRGCCYARWGKKKEIFEKHGIKNWRSPKIMNPKVHFD